MNQSRFRGWNESVWRGCVTLLRAVFWSGSSRWTGGGPVKSALAGKLDGGKVGSSFVAQRWKLAARRPTVGQLQQPGPRRKMARRCGRATSRFTHEIEKCPIKISICAVWMCFCLIFPSAAEAGLYSASDQVILLSKENAAQVLVNSSAAFVVEFYASWCGHCVAFSPVYKSLARDIKEWKPAVDLVAIDCADRANMKVCTDFGITGYPTIKFFHAYSKPGATGQPIRGFHRDVMWLRHKIIDKLETHEEPWPPACPPLEPTSQAELDSFFETNNVQHLALIFEESGSYVGREVTLDLLQFEDIAVRRVQSTEEALVTKLGVTEFPSCYLYYPGGNFTRLKVNIEARHFYSYALQRLPGVVRSGKPPPVIKDVHINSTEEPWRLFNKSRVYMGDLESALHYSLRMELSAHPVFRGQTLTALKMYISVLVKYFPGRPILMNLLKNVETWLKQSDEEISYDAFREILDNKAQSPDAALPDGVRWVGCQSSQPHLRRYPCGMWTLFHVLTVQAKNTGSRDSQEVLNAMRNYVHHFFGCRPCAEHFENMAKESMTEVNTLTSAVLWLWSRHNRVNNRLAGALSEDPDFPKIQWPSPEMCPSCHMVRDNGEHRWNYEKVLSFLLSYFSSSSIVTDYLESESQILEKQRQKHVMQQQALETHERKAREAVDSISQPPPSEPAMQEEEEEEEEGPQDEVLADMEEEGREAAMMEAKPTPWSKPEMNEGLGRRRTGKPSIVGMRMRELPQDIVDLDSFVNQHYKVTALEMAAARVKQRSLQRKEEQEPRLVFRLGIELDAGVGMVGLQPIDANFKQRKQLQKRELTGRYFEEEAEFNQKGHWMMSVFSIGFSKLDISLCVILYFLSCMCLLAMYLYFKNCLRLRRVKVALP
ncbi:sulfhydryl oxidase 1 [Notolabrus celidotus]|uniref:sulfhydryl oxidase 1 n=1 Tax=Notolabrus celidotus TaxID=1203425 RepID=UPI00149040FF|nr:sulfhydryl oxidase 1 [Notolabrus celidotus]